MSGARLCILADPPGPRELPVPDLRAIPAVPTSVTAFVGRTRRGPLDRTVAVSSYGEFASVFGGPWEGSELPVAVRDFFDNGGTDAVVARLHRPSGATSRAGLALGGLALEAADEGAWGNELYARVDHEGGDDRFRLSVRDGSTGALEIFEDLGVVPADPRPVTAVLAQESRLVRVRAPAATRPDVTAELPFAGGSDGLALDDDAFVASGLQAAERGLYLLEQADDVDLLVIPPYSAAGGVGPEVIAAAAEYCEERRAILLVDPPPAWRSVADVLAAGDGMAQVLGTAGPNAAAFFPRIRRGDTSSVEGLGSPSGAVAGVIARTDARRGVWTAPAGADATLQGVRSLEIALPDADIARLASIGVNALRALPGREPVVWGARTLEGGDGSASDWRYLPVRRLALFIEESLDRGTRWAVFEPNDEALWSRIRADAGAFLQGLFRQGALRGGTASQAYVVRCDGSTTTQADVDLGVVNIVVGFAPLRPAEFVTVRLQQLAGQPC